jgi:hypothetical protein
MHMATRPFLIEMLGDQDFGGPRNVGAAARDNLLHVGLGKTVNGISDENERWFRLAG